MKEQLKSAIRKSGILNLTHTLWRNRLTVLAWHRVTDPHAEGFDTYRPNVSATVEGFAQQVDWLRKEFDVIAMDDLLLWLDGKGPLPSRPALVTFDDGYEDNLTNALPVLKEQSVPATLFATSGFVDTGAPFFWDRAACLFAKTEQTKAKLPLLGNRWWKGEDERDALLDEWIAIYKHLSETERQAGIAELRESLGVSIDEATPKRTALNWDGLRALAEGGVTIGSHTVSHRILTSLTADEVEEELHESKRHIEEKIGRPVTTFAYPNGMPEDHHPTHGGLLKKTGYHASFTLSPAPCRFSEVREAPYFIRRTLIGHNDTFEQFVGKALGLNRAIALLKR